MEDHPEYYVPGAEADRALLTVTARDPKNLERVKVGDTMVVTYTEALAVQPAAQ